MLYAGNQFVWNVLCVLSRLQLEFKCSDRESIKPWYISEEVCGLNLRNEYQETVSSYMHDYDHAHICVHVCVCVLYMCVCFSVDVYVCMCVFVWW